MHDTEILPRMVYLQEKSSEQGDRQQQEGGGLRSEGAPT